MKRLVVFLDFDDVMCLNSPYGGYDVLDVAQGASRPQDFWPRLFSNEAVGALQHLFDVLDPSPAFVVSSSWRQVMPRPLLEMVLRNTSLGFVAEHLHEDWETPHCADHMVRRVWEIEQWVNAHPDESFVVLDDDCSGWDLVQTPWFQEGRVVLCSGNKGLTRPDIDSLLKRLVSDRERGFFSTLLKRFE